LGEPQWWNVRQTLAQEKAPIPVDMQQLLRNAEFYAVRLACSFASTDDAVIERARFSVKLEAHGQGDSDPIAFDLHPHDVYDTVKKQVDIKLSPSLKLHEVEASAGEAGINFQYDELIPEVTAFGLQTAAFSWDVKPTPSRAVRGVRLFHAVLKVDRTDGAAIARLHLSAWIRRRGILYHFVTPVHKADAMTRVVGRPR
jgi:hypothetical protein